MHMLSQRSTPYFHRAIIQSGSATVPWGIESRQVALHRAVILYEYMKCGNMSHNPQEWDMDKVLQCFMNSTAEKLRYVASSWWAFPVSTASTSETPSGPRSWSLPTSRG